MSWQTGHGVVLAAALAAFCLAGSSSPARAGDLIAHFHGNYCGTEAYDNTFRKRPIDALDAACKRHDRCYRKRRVSTYVCDQRLSAEAGRVAASARVSAEVRRKAGLLETVFAILAGW